MHAAVYGFLLSPNQTPYRDQIFLKLLVGLREPGEDFVVNQVRILDALVWAAVPLAWSQVHVSRIGSAFPGPVVGG